MESSYINSPVKAGIRQLLLVEAKRRPGTGRVLSLGGPNCHDVKLFAEEGFQVTSLERHGYVFEKQREVVGHLPNVTLLKTRLEDYLPAMSVGPIKQVPFSLAYLDLCGHYTLEREAAIKRFMRSSLLAPGATLAMTFAMAHERPELVRDGFVKERSRAIRKAISPKGDWLAIKYSHGNGAMQMLFMLTRKERCSGSRSFKTGVAKGER